MKNPRSSDRKLNYAPPLLCDMRAQLDRRLLLHGRCRRVVLSLVPSSSGNRSVSAQNSDASCWSMQHMPRQSTTNLFGSGHPLPTCVSSPVSWNLDGGTPLLSLVSTTRIACAQLGQSGIQMMMSSRKASKKKPEMNFFPVLHISCLHTQLNNDTEEEISFISS